MNSSDLIIVKDIYDYYIFNSTATYHKNAISLEELKTFIFINHPKYKSYMIYFNKMACGYCLITQYKRREAYDRTAELSVYLKPEYLGKGIGKKAILHLENEALNSGLKVLLGIISADNKSSIALFKNLNYTKCAHYRQVGEKFGKLLDVVVYQKIL